MDLSTISTQKGPLFSLPREIRDQITGYALIHGTIQIKPLRLPDDDPSISVPVQSSGSENLAFGYLATCRQAYGEGRTIFYSQNTFLLPLGQIGFTKCWAATLRAEHKAMIRSLHLKITWEDLQPHEYLDRLASLEFLPSGRVSRRSFARLDFSPGGPCPGQDEFGWPAIVEVTSSFISTMWGNKIEWLMGCNWGASHRLITDEHGLFQVAINEGANNDEARGNFLAGLRSIVRESVNTLGDMLVFGDFYGCQRDNVS